MVFEPMGVSRAAHARSRRWSGRGRGAVPGLIALKRAGSARRARRGDLQLGSTEAIKTAIALGAGLGFLSRFSIRRELSIGALKPLGIAGLRIQRDLSWVLPSGELAGSAARFVRIARQAPPITD